MKNFIDTHCESKIYCFVCRTNKAFRNKLNIPEICPHNITEFDNIQPNNNRQLIAKRLKLCKGCEYHTRKLKMIWCGAPIIDAFKKGKKPCGCNMHIKTRLRSSKCPIGKW